MADFMLDKWGLTANLFVSSPPDLATLSRVFTGRTDEIRTALDSVLHAPRRVLLNGLFGAGKTVLIRELCRKIKQRDDNVLIIEEQLYGTDRDLSQVILRGLATALKDRNDTASMIYENYLGQNVTRAHKNKNLEGAKTGVPKFLELNASDESVNEETRSLEEIPEEPVVLIRMLLDAARQLNDNGRIVFTIDDIDKRDPENVRNLLTSSRDLLHSPSCSFVLTSHPLGILRDAYSTSGGIIDREVDLGLMSNDTMTLMIARYLGAGRSKGWQFWRDPEFSGEVTDERALLPFTRATIDSLIRNSYGIPRILNIICFNIMIEAAKREFETIDYEELSICWEACSAQLKRGIRPDLRAMLELMAGLREPLNIEAIPDEMFDSLEIDTHEEMVQKIDYAMKNDLIVTENGRDFRLNNILRSAL